MIYSQYELPQGGTLYIAKVSALYTPGLSEYRREIQGLLDHIAPRGSWFLEHFSSGAPYLVSARGEALTDHPISISHSGAYVALAIRHTGLKERSHFGIDLQIANDKLASIAPRFMFPSEHEHYELLLRSSKQDALEWLYTAWGLKEAAYKAYPLSVQRNLASNFIISPHNSASGEDYTVCVDCGGGHTSTLTCYRLCSILDSPYHLTYVSAGALNL